MTALYAAMQVLGAALCLIAVVWAVRTRHQRRLWRKSQHDTSTVAIVLELEEKVRELEQMSSPTTDAPTIDAR